MIKKLFFLMAALSFIPALSQDQEMKKQKMNFYFNPSLHVGFNLTKEKEVPNNTQYIQPEVPHQLTYGITAVAGYHFLPNFALGSGIRYSFIEDNYHLLYWMIQPKFIFTPGDHPFYIDVNYGKQINSSVVSDSEFWGLRLGMQVSYSKRLSQEGGIVFENHRLGNSNPFLIGLSYGVTIFSNKNYTGYGED
ncbi:hypothetical protein ODZ84_21185 [Chryseobacterium fluminis]|uniref:hypothetical protein n=1 Tax=Chryseobacterium fluminis TaxID=2983606 RepID=UPI00224EC83D|nr:hypothetical protein [Chryseobacterium sp. MMS21-Ot14]UZT97659.1 hypothetical protein ODZ84_21185 [Chryseobacterium sp. MMS21-Ot14]